jgi:hypothetical protein
LIPRDSASKASGGAFTIAGTDSQADPIQLGKVSSLAVTTRELASELGEIVTGFKVTAVSCSNEEKEDATST